jgi:hypothetical protein
MLKNSWKKLIFFARQFDKEIGAEIDYTDSVEQKKVKNGR